MLSVGKARKVTIHLNEDTTAPSDFLYREIFNFLYERGVAGASMIRPAAGFGSHHRVHDRQTPNRYNSEHMPVLIEFIESEERVEELMPALCELVADGLVEAHDTTIYRSAAREEPV